MKSETPESSIGADGLSVDRKSQDERNTDDAYIVIIPRPCCNNASDASGNLLPPSNRTTSDRDKTNTGSHAVRYNVDRVRMESSVTADREDDVAIWYGFCKNIVHEYSRTSFTYPSGKLIALSGIAKMMRFKVDDVYIAGRWSMMLPEHLPWESGSTSGTMVVQECIVFLS